MPVIDIAYTREGTRVVIPVEMKKKEANGNMDDWFYDKWGS